MHNTSYNKYSNTPVMKDNIRFASKREAIRYNELKLLERAGKIKDLKLQVPFILQKAFTDWTGAKQRPIKYIADFMYLDMRHPDQFIVEDVKGHRTDLYKQKKKMFLYVYPDIMFFET